MTHSRMSNHSNTTVPVLSRHLEYYYGYAVLGEILVCSWAVLDSTVIPCMHSMLGNQCTEQDRVEVVFGL